MNNEAMAMNFIEHDADQWECPCTVRGETVLLAVDGAHPADQREAIGRAALARVEALGSAVETNLVDPATLAG